MPHATTANERVSGTFNFKRATNTRKGPNGLVNYFSIHNTKSKYKEQNASI